MRALLALTFIATATLTGCATTSTPSAMPRMAYTAPKAAPVPAVAIVTQVAPPFGMLEQECDAVRAGKNPFDGINVNDTIAVTMATRLVEDCAAE